MENKVLIKLTLPELDCCFDAFIPVNELIWKVNVLLIKSVSDLTGIPLEGGKDNNYILINKDTGEIYDNNSIIIDTNIRNSTELLMVSVNK